MPDLPTILLFALTALQLNLTPGPDMLYVLTRSIGQGRRAGLVSALGLSVGYVVYTLLTASGAAVLLQNVPPLFQAVRLGGAVYLVYLGLRTWRQPPTGGPPRPATDAPAPTDSASAANWAVFRQGALTSTLNPSIAIFFLALLPGFVEAARGSAFTQIVALGLVFVSTATTVHSLIALLAGSAGDWLRGRRGAARLQRWISGGVLIGLGLRVLLATG